jgi:diphthamide biosynthesis enzyme Dph1/Dph2-like protein
VFGAKIWVVVVLVVGGNLRHEQALVFVLGDTTFAPCCSDAIAAQHLEADCVVHYGHACLSPCRDIPVLYSSGRQQLSTRAYVEAVVAEVEVKKQKKESDSVQ